MTNRERNAAKRRRKWERAGRPEKGRRTDIPLHAFAEARFRLSFQNGMPGGLGVTVDGFDPPVSEWR